MVQFKQRHKEKKKASHTYKINNNKLLAENATNRKCQNGFRNLGTITLKMLGCFRPTLGQIWTNPAIGLNMYSMVCPYLTQS